MKMSHGLRMPTDSIVTRERVTVDTANVGRFTYVAVAFFAEFDLISELLIANTLATHCAFHGVLHNSNLASTFLYEELLNTTF